MQDTSIYLWQEIDAYRQNGGTVLLTTHYLEEAEVLASRVVILHKGQKVCEGSVEEIKAQAGLKRVRFAANSFPALPAVARVEQENGIYSLYTADPDALVRSLVQQNVDFNGLEVTSTTLEEAFLFQLGVFHAEETGRPPGQDAAAAHRCQLG